MMKNKILIITLLLLSCLLISSCTTQESTKIKTNTSYKIPDESETVILDEETVPEEIVPEDLTHPTEEEGAVYISEPDPNAQVGTVGSKTVIIEITDKNGAVSKEIKTDAGDLMSVLKETGLGQDDPESPGYIITVNGYTADSNNYEWWNIYRNSEPLTNSADQTPVHDGDTFEFILQGM